MGASAQAGLAPISTERLRLVRFTEEHLTPRYVAWLNDPEVTRYSEQRHTVHTLQSCTAYFRSFESSASHFLAIESVDAAGGHIGNITVAVDPPNGLADISILIGAAAARGRGFGLEAWSAVMEALLAQPGTRKVTGGTTSVNAPMLAIMRKAGMAEDGVRRRHHMIDGVAVDVVYYAAFRNAAGSATPHSLPNRSVSSNQ